MSDTARASQRRRLIRTFAAIVTVAITVMYILIGLHLVTVLDGDADQKWGLAAAAAYAVGIWLLIKYDRRTLWILGALLQVFVIYTYFNVASQRSPAYEIWGILLRIAQFILLGLLVYLAYRQPFMLESGSDDRPRNDGAPKPA